MTDSELVRIARSIDRHNERIEELMRKIEDSDLPNADELIDFLGLNGFDHITLATHCIHDYMRNPGKWETGPWGIRRKTIET